MPDSTRVLPLEDFLDWVRHYHPVMQTASLLNDNSNAEQMKARGNFDPKLYGDYDHKNFADKEYFRIGEAGLKVPTWFGADVKLAYTWSEGVFLNPENSLPSAGQAVAGIELPLLRGLFFDDRRAQVQQAQFIRDANAAEAKLIMNDLLLDAIEQYWDWAYAYQVVQVYENSLELANTRFDIIRESFLQGDKPAIDTLETLIQVENRVILLNQALVDYENERLKLSNFLWYEDLTPLEITDTIYPDDTAPIVIPEDIITSNWLRAHPDLRIIDVKRQSLQIKERLKRENLKPELDVEYNLLSEGADFTPDSDGFNTLLNDNYKWGVNFNYPLFTRKERAGLELVRLEQLENGYK
ncbi:MAG: TolC family protein, partial [Bacteroidota bacterium]